MPAPKPTEPALRPAVFLDRDGTINVEAGYLRRLEDLVLMPGAAAAVRELNRHGVLAILVTNQTGPARGYYPERHVQALNQRLCDLLAEQGAHLDDVYYCPHLPEGVVPEYAIACRCRKPGTLMVEDAAEKHGIDLSQSYVVGDKATDVDLGENAGCRTVLLRCGYGEQVLSGTHQHLVSPDFVAADLAEAVPWILEDLTRRDLLPARQGVE